MKFRAHRAISRKIVGDLTCPEGVEVKVPDDLGKRLLKAGLGERTDTPPAKPVEKKPATAKPAGELKNSYKTRRISYGPTYYKPLTWAT